MSLPTWPSSYDWAAGHGYNGWHAIVSSQDPAGYGFGSALGGLHGPWIWLTGDREYRPGTAEWRFTAPGTTRIASARFELAYASKLLAHHCVTVGVGDVSGMGDRRTDCSPATDRANVSFSAADPSSSPTSKRAVLQVAMPACHNPSDQACSKWIPSHDPLTNGAFARLKSVAMVLVDDDLPQVAASGPLRELADRYIDGRVSYAVTVEATDAGAGVKKTSLEKVGEGEVKGFAAACDSTHNTASLDSAICPPSRSGSTSVDTSALLEGRHTYRATAADLAGNARTSGAWSFLVDRTPPAAPAEIGADYDEEQSAAVIWWSSNADPALADGSPGSGAVGEVYRYRLGNGSWTAWASTDRHGFTIRAVQPGTRISVEARTSDLVGNLSPVASAEFTIDATAECGEDKCPAGDDLEEESFLAQCNGGADKPDWCEYVKGVYHWADELAAAAAPAGKGSGLKRVGVRAAAAELADRPPLPPGDFKAPADCARRALSVKRCFDAVDRWQATMTSWLAERGLTGERAAKLPPMPVFHYARSDLARDLTRASAGAFAVVVGTRADHRSEAAIRISFDSPVGVRYLDGLLDDLRADNAQALRGTYFGETSTVTAGYNAGDSDLRTQLRTFYGQQLAGTATIIDGLKQDLAVDATEAERRATRAEINNVARFRAALDDGDAFVSAIVVEGDERAILRAMTESGSPVQSIDAVSPRQEPDAAGAPQPSRAIAEEHDAEAKIARVAATQSDPEIRAAATSPKKYMPNRWNVRTVAVLNTDAPFVKNSYMGFRWTQPKTLDWYQGDDHHDRGFEAQARPFKGGGLWSTNWYKTHWYGDDVTRGPCPDTRPGCNAVWNSNMPDAYRDDLSSDGDYKAFAVGTGDGKSLEYQTPYFAWYLTNKGETTGGRAVAEGQATRRPSDAKERGYCLSHGDSDSACFFAEATKPVATYPVESRYHKYIRAW